MSEKKIFFSYSRDDSEFVLNLAKELRADGANVWLDQLDIKPGTRWDKSIEDALDASQTVLVILSKTSVASNNVMDEVSYALEEGKTVLPALLEDCDIPFRLRRLQFADFRISHDKGKQTLTKALELTKKEVSEQQPEVKPPQETPVETKQEVIKPTTPRETKEITTPQNNAFKKNRIPIYIISGIAVVLAIMFATGVFNTSEPEKTRSNDSNDEILVDMNTDDLKEVPTPDLSEVKKELKFAADEIKFESGKPSLKDSESAMNRLVNLLEKHPSLKINIDCHTDSMGAATGNLRLSQMRASFIKKVMVNKGVAADRIIATGYGEDNPIADNSTSAGREQNRRVEITITQ